MKNQIDRDRITQTGQLISEMAEELGLDFGFESFNEGGIHSPVHYEIVVYIPFKMSDGTEYISPYRFPVSNEYVETSMRNSK